MSLTIPITFLEGSYLGAQQLNSVNSAIASEVNAVGADTATNTANIATLTTNLAKLGSYRFFAYSGATSTAVTADTVTTVTIDTNPVDSGGTAFDQASTYTFTPLQAGTYLLNASVNVTDMASGTTILYITKNTTNYPVAATSANGNIAGSIVMTANGASDTFKVRVKNASDAVTITYASFSGACIFA